MTSSKHENIFLCIYKEMNHTCKMDYSPRPEKNILSLFKEMNVNSKMQYSSNTVNELHSFILAISIAPLQVLYHSEALPTTARTLYRSFTPKRTGNCRYRTCPTSLRDG